MRAHPAIAPVRTVGPIAPDPAEPANSDTMTTTLATTSPPETARPGAPVAVVAPARRRLGFASLGAGLSGSLVWFGWWLAHLEPNPFQLVVLLLSLGGSFAGVAIAIGLVTARMPRDVLTRTSSGVETTDPSRFAWAVADVVGRTRANDLHHDVRGVVRAARRSIRRSPADYAMAAVLIDGALRLLTVVTVGGALLLGLPPIPAPGSVALVGLAVGVAGMSLSHAILSGGRIRIGDRIRWSFSSLGEVIGREDLAGVAPRRWVGTIATIVGLNLAVALRGISDRWTHGLQPMADDQRVVAMLAALTLVVGALYTLATTEEPRLDNAHLVSRRLEERTARQSVLGAAVCVGLIGLIAGILPGRVDTADDDPRRVEQVEQPDPVTGLGDG